MRLKHGLLLALAGGAIGAAYLASEWALRLREAADRAGGDSPAAAYLREVSMPYLLGLMGLAAINLAAIVLLLATLREERRQAMERAARAVGATGKALAELTSLPKDFPWGRLAPWSAEGARAFWEVWRVSSPAVKQPLSPVLRTLSGPMEAGGFEVLLAAPEFDAESSAVALLPDGKCLGGLVAMRPASLETESCWWLEAPGLIAGVAVAETHRGKGVGLALVQHAEAVARKHRRPRLFAGSLENLPRLLPGIPEWDHGARGFFGALGYREARRTCLMRAECGAFAPPRELVEREARLAADGFSFVTARDEDLPMLRGLLGGLRPGSDLAAPGASGTAAAVAGPALPLETAPPKEAPPDAAPSPGAEASAAAGAEEGADDEPSRLFDTLSRRRAWASRDMNPARFLLAWKSGRIVGFVQVATKDSRGASALRAIWISDDHRGLGLGSLLLAKAHVLWQAQGATHALLWTFPEAAERFYPRAGFKLLEEWTCYLKELPHGWDDPEFVKRWRE